MDGKKPVDQQSSLLRLLLDKYINPQEIVKRYDSVKTSRKPWETKWQLIQDQIFPDYRDYTNYAQSNSTEPGASKIKNHSSAISGKINKVVSLLSSQLCDPSVQWLSLKFGNDVLNSQKPAVDWLSSCKEVLYDLFSDPESNFYPSTYSFHLDWFTIGTACREISLRRDNGRIIFNTVSMQNIYAELSGYGDIDSIYRSFFVTPKQAYDLWGNGLHQSQLQLIQSGKETSNPKKYEYIEVSMPNPMRQQIPTLEYMTCVIDKTNKHLVDAGVHSNSPYVVSRFFVAPGETYGRSYVWNAMPDIKSINKISKRLLQGIDFATLPVNLVKDAGSITQTQITPGAFIQGLDAAGRPTIQPMQMGGNIPMGMDFYTRKLEDLDEALVAREVFPAEHANMTATEVNERKIQASNRIRPLLVRLEAEDLNKTIIRALSLLQQTGGIPPFPYDALKILPEQLPNPLLQMRVRFSGQMAKMQRLQEIVNSDMLFQKTMQAAQVDQSVLDRINLDALIMEDANIYEVSGNIINSDETVQRIREARAKQQQEQQVAQMGSTVLDNILKMKEAGIDANAMQ